MLPQHDLLSAVRDLYSAMHRFDQWAARCLDLNPSDLRCVNALERGPLSPSALATHLGITRGAITAMLDRLDRAGFIERVPLATDRRRYAVQLRRPFYRKASQVYSRLGISIQSHFPPSTARHNDHLITALRALAQSFDDAPLR